MQHRQSGKVDYARGQEAGFLDVRLPPGEQTLRREPLAHPPDQAFSRRGVTRLAVVLPGIPPPGAFEHRLEQAVVQAHAHPLRADVSGIVKVARAEQGKHLEQDLRRDGVSRWIFSSSGIDRHPGSGIFANDAKGLV